MYGCLILHVAHGYAEQEAYPIGAVYIYIEYIDIHIYLSVSLSSLNPLPSSVCLYQPSPIQLLPRLEKKKTILLVLVVMAATLNRVMVLWCTGREGYLYLYPSYLSSRLQFLACNDLLLSTGCKNRDENALSIGEERFNLLGNFIQIAFRVLRKG